MIKAVPYKAEHFLELYKESTEGDVGHSVQYLAKQHEWNPATTLMYDGRIIACSGVSQLWPGVGALWTLITKNKPGNGVLFIGIANHWINQIMEGYRRIQAEVLASDESAVRFAEFMGFECEGLMKSYGPLGQDYYLYARVNHGQ